MWIHASVNYYERKGGVKYGKGADSCQDIVSSLSGSYNHQKVSPVSQGAHFIIKRA